MHTKELLNYLKEGHIVVSKYLLKKHDSLNITLEELMLISLILGRGEKTIFNPLEFSLDLGIETSECLNIIDSLVKKKYANIINSKNEMGKIEEYITFESLYNKLALDVISNPSDLDDNRIFEVFEKEFGRCLSPVEFEIINTWLSEPIDESLIKEALKEATYNGVSNLRYIDKILFEWKKKGYKTKEDVKKRSEKKEELVTVKPFDYNWFDDEE